MSAKCLPKNTQTFCELPQKTFLTWNFLLQSPNSRNSPRPQNPLATRMGGSSGFDSKKNFNSVYVSKQRLKQTLNPNDFVRRYWKRA